MNDYSKPTEGRRRFYLAVQHCPTLAARPNGAAKVLNAPPRVARELVEAGLHRYAITGQGDVKALQGRDGYRLRMGSYRAIFDEDATTILAIYIVRRTTMTYQRR